MGEIESFAKRKEKWLRKYLELPHGIPTDDTYRLVMRNIDTGHFFHLTVQLLLHTIDGILGPSGKQGDVHEKDRIRGWEGKPGIQAEERGEGGSKGTAGPKCISKRLRDIRPGKGGDGRQMQQDNKEKRGRGITMAIRQELRES